jgi:hypothetical protein
MKVSPYDIQFDHLGLRVAFGALRPKPVVEHLGLRVAFGALRPKPHIDCHRLDGLHSPGVRERKHSKLRIDDSMATETARRASR